MPKMKGGGYKAPSRRVFGGLSYGLYGLYSYKAQAERDAVGMRSGAYLVRVVKLPHSFGWATYYRVRPANQGRSH